MYKSGNVWRGQSWFTAEGRPNILCKSYIKSKFNGLQNYKLLSPRNYLKFIMVNKKVLLDDSLLLASRNWKVWNIDILLVISTWQIKLNHFTTKNCVLWWSDGVYQMGPKGDFVIHKSQRATHYRTTLCLVRKMFLHSINYKGSLDCWFIALTLQFLESF